MAVRDYLSKHTHKPAPAYRADVEITVSPEGPSWDEALGLLEKSRRENPEKSVTLRVLPGEYRVRGLTVTEAMSGTPEAPVTIAGERGRDGARPHLNGGAVLPGADFVPVPEDIRARLRGPARENAVCADLKRYGLTRGDIGEICAVGGFKTDHKYDGAQTVPTAEVFFNGKRMTMARYPSQGYLKLEDVTDAGDCREFPQGVISPGWDERRNHRGGAYRMRPEDAARAAGWKNLNDIWMFGYPYWDWADASAPVTLDCESRTIYPEYVSRYGARRGAEYCFFNVLDELSEPGEYYIDRENLLLYLYPAGPMDGAVIELSLSPKPLMTIEGARGITIDGLTLSSVRGNGISASGDGLTLRDLVIKNTAENGIVISGSHNLVTECEISHTGRGGVVLSGGDRVTLTPGLSGVENCDIHDFAEIYRTYAGGIHLNGAGNFARHNEIYQTPHTAIFYYGNDHVIEYNYLHDVIIHCLDGGAIYNGRDWNSYGVVIRYNVIENLGSADMRPFGIYWDDALPGQTAYGNLLFRAGSHAFHIGGGFDNTIRGNLIVDVPSPLCYDDRAREGLTAKGWYGISVSNRDAEQWEIFGRFPHDSEVWKRRYPIYARLRTDVENPEAWDDPYLPTNPARVYMRGNVSLCEEGAAHLIADSVKALGNVSDNPIFASSQARELGFKDPENGDFSLRDNARLRELIPDFPDIPYAEIGRN